MSALCRTTLLLVGVASSLAPAAAQEPPPELRRDVFRVDTEVVLLDVVVRDKKGRTVRDLRPGEVQLLEDGARQEIGGFRFLDSRAIGEAAEEAAAEAAATAAPAPPGPRPGQSRHLNLVTLLFDQLDVDGRSIARKAALHFLELEDRPDVYVSVFQIGEALRLLQQFTTDRDLARNAVLRATGELDTQYTAATEKLTEAVVRTNALRDQLASSAQGGTLSAEQLGQEVAMADMVVNTLRMTDTLQREQQGRSVLFAILALARQQQKLAGRKTILFFSEGVQTPPTLEHVLLASISEANRANVSVYGVDSRGLSTISSADAARDTLKQAADTSMQQQMSRGSRLVSQEEVLLSDTTESSLRMDTVSTLRQLAESTGGMLIGNSNDVRRGVAHAVGDLRGYYEIAYSPTNRSFDGRFRRVSLRVTRPGVSVQTRSGYFALPPGDGTASFPYEVELLGALRAPAAAHDFPITRARSSSVSRRTDGATRWCWRCRCGRCASRRARTAATEKLTSRSWGCSARRGGPWPRSSARTCRSRCRTGGSSRCSSATPSSCAPSRSRPAAIGSRPRRSTSRQSRRPSRSRRSPFPPSARWSRSAASR
jgi:VWFA-related protein